MQIDAQFPGGNIIVEKIDGDTAFIRQDLRDTEGDWFYWCFRVRGAAGRTVTSQFTGKDVFAAFGPAVSIDRGATWRWLGRACVTDKAFTYAFGQEADEVRFSMGMPYVQTNLERFLAQHKANAHLVAETLCTARKGRVVERLRFGRLDGRAPMAAVFTCRHHCCEMMANYALEGIIEAALADDDLGRWFRENVEALAIPFADKDGVEDGDQGKNRRPHDHGRDYGDDTLYPEPRAAKGYIPQWSAGRPIVAMDLHCPWIRSEGNEHVYLVASENQAMWARTKEFSAVLEATMRGPLPYAAAGDLPFGQSWNTYDGPLLGFKRWAERLPNTRLAVGLELPYATVNGHEVNQSTAQLFGRDLAAALQQHCAAW